MIFGSVSDAAMLLHIGRELVQEVVEQEVLYYKPDIEDMQENLYGEYNNKYYYMPVHLNCLIKRGDQEWKTLEYGPDVFRTTSFAFFKGDMRKARILPEVGDIIEWSKTYFEVDAVKENQMFLGKDQDYRIDEATWNFGHSVSYVLTTHMARIDRLNVKSYESGKVDPDTIGQNLYR